MLIRQALERLVHNRTVLVIAHRYNTIASAEQIAIMEHGAIVEIDKPERLLQQDGAYAQLMEMYRKARVTI
jgi:ATP-binding cassette subfamily B protein IrtA